MKSSVKESPVIKLTIYTSSIQWETAVAQCLFPNLFLIK